MLAGFTGTALQYCDKGRYAGFTTVKPPTGGWSGTLTQMPAPLTYHVFTGVPAGEMKERWRLWTLRALTALWRQRSGDADDEMELVWAQVRSLLGSSVVLRRDDAPWQ